MSPSLVKILPARLLTLGEAYLISIVLPPMVLDSVAAGLCADARLAAAMSAPAHIERDFMVYSSLGRACQRAGSYSTSNESRTPWWLLLLQEPVLQLAQPGGGGVGCARERLGQFNLALAQADGARSQIDVDDLLFVDPGGYVAAGHLQPKLVPPAPLKLPEERSLVPRRRSRPGSTGPPPRHSSRR